jgi:hypothetical protein
MPYEVIAIYRQSRFTYRYTIGNPFDRTITGTVKVAWHGINLERMVAMNNEGRRLRRKTHSRQINGMFNAIRNHRRFRDVLPASVDEWLHEDDSKDDLSDEQAREKRIWGDVRDESPPINGKIIPVMREVE